MSYPSDISSMMNAGVSLIQAYGDGGFRISNRRHEGSILLLPGLAVTPWAVGKISELTSKSLDPVLQLAEDVDILLLGCGTGLVPVKPDIKKKFSAEGIVIEPMDTGAACRTFNVLAAEERRVAAALIAVE